MYYYMDIFIISVSVVMYSVLICYDYINAIFLLT